MNCSNIVWIKKLLKGIKEVINEHVVIYCDNTSVIRISKNPMMHKKAKQIEINYHYSKELVKEKEVRLGICEHKGVVS